MIHVEELMPGPGMRKAGLLIHSLNFLPFGEQPGKQIGLSLLSC